MKKIVVVLSLIFISSSVIVLAHCDTMDGPVVADAKKALNQKNINYVLKWVHPEYEKELTSAFDLTMKVRGLNNDAREIADKYFFETVVRLHRTGEGMSYTGIKPEGTPVDEKIKAADRSLETGDIAELKKMVPQDIIPELSERFEKALALRSFDVNDVTSGRKFVEAYVQFFHFAEGAEEESHAHH